MIPSSPDNTYEIDFMKEIQKGPQIIQIENIYSKVVVSYVAYDSVIAIIGNKLLFQCKRNDLTQHFYLIPSINSNIEIYTAENSTISIYNKFPSIIFYQLSVNIYLEKFCKVNFLKAQWLLNRTIFTINQFYPAEYTFYCNIVPIRLIQLEKADSIFKIGTDSINFYGAITISSSITIVPLQNKFNHLEFNIVQAKSRGIIFNANGYDLEISFLNIISGNIDFLKSNLKIGRVSFYDGTFLKGNSLEVSDVTIYSGVYEINVPFIQMNNSVSINRFSVKYNTEEIAYNRWKIIRSGQQPVFDLLKLIFLDTKVIIPLDWYFDNETLITQINFQRINKQILDKLYVTEKDTYFADAYVTDLSSIDEVFNKITETDNKFEIFILDEYEEPINIKNMSSVRTHLAIISQSRKNKVNIIDQGSFKSLDFKNLTLINTRNEIDSISIELTDCYLPVGVLIDCNRIRTSTSIIETKEIITKEFTVLFGHPFVLNETGFFSSDSVIYSQNQNRVVYTIITFGDAKIETTNFPMFVSTGKTTSLSSDLQINKIHFIDYANLDLKYFPLVARFNTRNINISKNTKFDENSVIEFVTNTTFYPNRNNEIKIKRVSFMMSGTIMNQNHYLRPHILNISSTITNINETIPPSMKSDILSISPTCYFMLDKVSEVEFIDIHYTITQAGYLIVKNFISKNFIHTTKNDNLRSEVNSKSDKTKNNSNKDTININISKVEYIENAKKAKCPGGLHVRFYNDDIEDQFFYDGDWDDFNIDFICFDSFEVNESCLSYEFLSHHWDFNGSTRTFDMSISKKNSQTCISLVHRDYEESHEEKKEMNKTPLIVGLSIAALILVIAVILLAIAMVKISRRRLNSFTYSDTLTESLI